MALLICAAFDGTLSEGYLGEDVDTMPHLGMRSMTTSAFQRGIMTVVTTETIGRIHTKCRP